MKIASIFLATALVAVVGSVQPTFAQPYDSSGDQAGSSSESGSEMNAPSHPHNNWDRDRDWGSDHEDHGMRGGRWDHGGMWRHHHMGMMGHHMGMMRMMGARERGARFHFKRGDATIDIRCPTDEDVSACVNAASKLIDKIATMGGEHPPGSHANPPPPPNNPPPPPNSPPPPGGTNGTGNQGNNGPGNQNGGAPPFNNRT
jgi:hypothetical protein